jgi:hypothetical protein
VRREVELGAAEEFQVELGEGLARDEGLARSGQGGVEVVDQLGALGDLDLEGLRRQLAADLPGEPEVGDELEGGLARRGGGDGSGPPGAEGEVRLGLVEPEFQDPAIPPTAPVVPGLLAAEVLDPLLARADVGAAEVLGEVLADEEVHQGIVEDGVQDRVAAEALGRVAGARRGVERLGLADPRGQGLAVADRGHRGELLPLGPDPQGEPAGVLDRQRVAVLPGGLLAHVVDRPRLLGVHLPAGRGFEGIGDLAQRRREVGDRGGVAGRRRRRGGGGGHGGRGLVRRERGGHGQRGEQGADRGSDHGHGVWPPGRGVVQGRRMRSSTEARISPTCRTRSMFGP